MKQEYDELNKKNTNRIYQFKEKKAHLREESNSDDLLNSDRRLPSYGSHDLDDIEKAERVLKNKSKKEIEFQMN